MISDQMYLDWQQSLTARKFFRRFWIFWGIYSIWFVFIASIHLFFINESRVVLMAFISFVLARGILSPLIFEIYARQRPYQKLKFIPLHSWLLSMPTKRFSSFPSDHAISFASIGIVFTWYFPILGACLLGVAVLNGIARVLLGYHYISDVLAGWIIGLFCGVGVIYAFSSVLFTR